MPKEIMEPLEVKNMPQLASGSVGRVKGSTLLTWLRSEVTEDK
jgi:hypothetical protein